MSEARTAVAENTTAEAADSSNPAAVSRLRATPWMLSTSAGDAPTAARNTRCALVIAACWATENGAAAPDCEPPMGENPRKEVSCCPAGAGEAGRARVAGRDPPGGPVVAFVPAEDALEAFGGMPKM